MPVIRLALLLVILGGLTLFALQNWSPSLALRFLGVQTQTFPLAFWMVGAIAIGAFTTLIIASLFAISNTLSRPASRRRAAQSSQRTANNPVSSSWRSEWGNRQESEPVASRTNTSGDDWERSSKEEWDDWEDDQESSSAEPVDSTSASGSTYSSPADGTFPSIPRNTSYEVPQEPQASSQSGSVYSYSYREPTDSGVGKTESVYDADYRVIVPPLINLDGEEGGSDWANRRQPDEGGDQNYYNYDNNYDNSVVDDSQHDEQDGDSDDNWVDTGAGEEDWAGDDWTTRNQDEDDWGFDEDDFEGVEGDRSRG